MSKKLRIAMIGLGDIAQKAYLPIISNHPLITPILCTRNLEVLNKFTDQYRISESYSRISDLLRARPDAVMVHTATSSHFEIVHQFLKAGIATFVDKPLSDDINECNVLLELARLNNTHLYVGFNRRFAPLIAEQIYDSTNHIRWQKNRVTLPENPREFIFNDFIHVVDSLSFLSKMKPHTINDHALTVTPLIQGKLLAAIHFQYEYEGVLLNGCMNRNSGKNEERVEVFLNAKKVQIDNLVEGHAYSNNEANNLRFNDWQSYLYTRGFIDMIEDWLQVVRNKNISNKRLENIAFTHQFCEHLIQRIEC